MAKQGLIVPDVRAVFEKMRGAGVKNIHSTKFYYKFLSIILGRGVAEHHGHPVICVNPGSDLGYPFLAERGKWKAAH